MWSRLKALWRGVTKGFEINFIPIDAAYSGHLPRTRYPYSRTIREGYDSNVIMSPVSWIIRNFTEAETVTQRRENEAWKTVIDHPITVRLEAPNNFYDGDLLWKGTLTSYLLDGNGYWWKIRNAFGDVVELWYLPHFLVEPRWPKSGSVFIDHYEYRPAGTGQVIRIPPRDIVHLRWGLDPENTRKGMSALRPLFREVFTDEEASNFAASILRNMGVPGGVIAPKDATALPSQDDVEKMKDYMRTGFTGDRRGEWLVLGTPTETQQFGYDPNQLLLANLRDITEERVCSMLGIPAAVVGFGAGLQQTKVGATMKELRRLAWVSCIIPHQNSLARQVTRQLVPDFQSQIRRFRVRFDQSQVSAFLEEETERARRVALLVEKGVLRVDRAQELLGLDVDPTQAVYLRPTSVTAVTGETAPAAPAAMPAPSVPMVPDSSNGDSPNRVEETLARATRMIAAVTDRQEM